MKAKTVVYITSTELLCSTEWFAELVSDLKMALGRTLNTELSFNVKKESDDLDAIEGNVKKSDIYITAIDVKEESSEDFLNELNFISDFSINERQCELAACLYKVNLTTPISTNQPATFDSINGYNFFDFQGRKNIASKFDFNKPDHRSAAWNLIIDLSFDIKDALPILNNSETQSVNHHKQVYLASCSPELTTVRDELKREFQHFGFSVLPKTNVDFEEYESTVSDILSECDFIIQLLGSKYGEIKRGERVSKFEKENILLSEFLEKEPDKHRFIWVPDFFKRKEQRQVLYINRVKQKETGFNTEIVESSLDEFKDILSRRMVKGEAFVKKVVVEGGVYLITPPNSENDPLINLAEKDSIVMKKIDFEQKSTLYHQHIDLLTTSDNVLIVWDNNDEFWLKSKLSDLIKAPGIGRKNPFKSIGVIVKGNLPDVTSYTEWLPDISVIKHNDKTELKKFFEGIIE